MDCVSKAIQSRPITMPPPQFSVSESCRDLPHNYVAAVFEQRLFLSEKYCLEPSHQLMATARRIVPPRGQVFRWLRSLARTTPAPSPSTLAYPLMRRAKPREHHQDFVMLKAKVEYRGLHCALYLTLSRRRHP